MITEREYETTPFIIPLFLAGTYFIAQFFISPSLIFSFPISVIALILSYLFYKNYAVFFSEKVRMFVFGRKYDFKYDEIENVTVRYQIRGGYFIIIKIKNRIKPLGFRIFTNDKPILKRIESKGIKIRFENNLTIDHFHDPY